MPGSFALPLLPGESIDGYFFWTTIGVTVSFRDRPVAVTGTRGNSPPILDDGIVYPKADKKSQAPEVADLARRARR